MKARYWSLALVLVLINYLIFALLFSRLMEADFNPPDATRTPIPTFTPAPAEPYIIVPTLTPPTVEPTATPTKVISSGGDRIDDAPASNEESAIPQLTSPSAVNIRSGPGLDYATIGTLNANTARPIVGRTGNGAWWQIELTDDQLGWVSNTVVNVTNAEAVPVVEISAQADIPAAQPAASNAPPEPEKPKHQFTPTGWYDDGNQSVTRFWGDIKDSDGNPVNGVFVQASCGQYSTISFPSGPVGWGSRNESSDWAAGFYDITVDEKPVPCVWVLSIVETEDRQTVTATLSEAIPVEVTLEKSVIVANWQKNW